MLSFDCAAAARAEVEVDLFKTAKEKQPSQLMARAHGQTRYNSSKKNNKVSAQRKFYTGRQKERKRKKTMRKQNFSLSSLA
jgi:hypothetical protein